MLPDVRVKITDGGLGILPPSLAGKHAKVGVCSLGNVNEIVILTDRDQVAGALGTGPLANACYDHLTEGGLVYAVRAAGDVAGEIGEITKTGTGTGNMTAAGSPLDNYQIIVEILDAGGLNVATFRYTLDGGDTYSPKITVPTAGTYVISGTGITLTFTIEEGTPFAAGDKYSFNPTAPQASINSINAAIDALLNSNYTYEKIHVVGPSDNSVWAALDIRAKDAESNFRYISILAEARGPNAGETVDQWVAALLEMRASFASTRVQVCAGRFELVDAFSGLLVDRNGAGIYSGRVAALPVQSSPGKVNVGPLPGIVKLMPTGINEGHIQTLDEAGFITFRQYVDLNGFYITNGRMMAEVISDYQFEETRRTMDKACRNCRIAALAFEHGELEINEDGSINEGSLRSFEAHLQVPLDQMKADKEVSGSKISIDRNQNILSTSKLKAKLRIIPIAIMREIELDIGLENPFITSNS
ncbi:MAG: DUF2586 domain-containing protein [Bacteroidota bacterium]